MSVNNGGNDDSIKIPEDESKKPSCPICMEVPYEPYVGSCGHTVCLPCKEKIKTTCPLCKQKVTFRVNFMLRDILMGGQYASEYKERQLVYNKSTPQGILESYKSRYPNLTIYSPMNLSDQVLLLQEVERWINHRSTTGTFSDFELKFKLDSYLICKSNDFSLVLRENRNYFHVFIGDYFFQALSQTKKLKLI